MDSSNSLIIAAQESYKSIKGIQEILNLRIFLIDAEKNLTKWMNKTNQDEKSNQLQTREIRIKNCDSE